MKRIALLLSLVMVLALALGGCASLSNFAGAAPDQEEVAKSVEGKALTKAGTFVKAIADNIGKLSTTAVIQPIDPSKPMVIDNGMVTVRVVDSSVMTMVTSLSEDFTRYRSPPGFWSWMIDLTGLGKQAIKSGLPWAWALTEAVKNGGNRTTTYNVHDNQDSPTTFGGGGSINVQTDRTVAGNNVNSGDGSGDGRNNSDSHDQTDNSTGAPETEPDPEPL